MGAVGQGEGGFERLARAAREGGLEELKEAARGADPKELGSLCLSLAAARADADELALWLIPRSDPAAGGWRALRCALASGSSAVALALIEAGAPLKEREQMLSLAASKGRGEEALALMRGLGDRAWAEAARSARAAGFEGLACEMEGRILASALGRAAGARRARL